MAEQVDLEVAQRVMDDAVVMEKDASLRGNPEFQVWEQRIEGFSKLVAQVNYTASIALVGGALIAKATNSRINPMSLQASDTTPGAYSVRRPAEMVLYPASLIHKFDIGSSSKNPLNGQTFNKLKRIDLTLKIKGKGQQLVKPLVELLHEVSLLASREDGVRALAAYIHVRRGYLPNYKKPPAPVGLDSAEALIEAIADFVSQDSEGGGRAQAVVGGLLDAVYGPYRIRVGKPNEPDRKVAGDVIVRESMDENSGTINAFEVRDKPVSEVDLLSIVQKLQRASVVKGAVVAVAANQKHIERVRFDEAARSAGLRIELYDGWTRLVLEALFWSDKTEAKSVRMACNQIRARIIEIGLSSKGLDHWDRLTTKVAPVQLI
jgi:hypothetical protein